MSDESAPSRFDPSYTAALVPLASMVAVVAGCMALFGLDALNGPLQAGLVVCSMITGVVLLLNGHAWEEVAAAGQRGLASIVSAIFILLAVGALIGTWNLSGTIPTLVYYGIQWIDPDWYYLTTATICAAVSLSIGSSWTTAGTIGVGLVGIASLVGVSPVITAGAVISGSYLGDKTSPLSETTVLASQLVGLDISTHIRAQAWTSVPSFLLAAAVFALLGLGGEGVGPDEVATSAELAQLGQIFWITPLNLIPLAALLLMSLKKAPSSLAILSAALLAGVLAVFLQPDVVLRFVDEPGLAAPVAHVKGVWLALASGYEARSGLPEVDALLSRGGMDSMLKTVWLILGAVVFGTLLEEFGLLAKLLDPLLARAHTAGRLVATTAGTALGLNVVAADQYIALILPARFFRPAFQARRLRPEMLSRTVADAGTVTSPLVPWNSCGAYMSAVLGVPTLLYLPFCIFNIASPILTTLYGFAAPRTLPPGPEDADPSGATGES